MKNANVTMASPGCFYFAEYLSKALDCEVSPYNSPVSTKIGILFGVFATSQTSFFTPLRDCDTKIAVWVGTDVIQLRSLIDATPEAPLWINKYLDLRLADAPNLATELIEMGIEVDGVIETPPKYIFNKMPLPDKPKVGIYAPPLREKFYYTDLMMEVAKEFPDVEFRLYGFGRKFNEDDILSNQLAPNVWDIGQIDMEQNMEQFSAIIRVCEHDGISNGLIEFMQAGRYAITNQDVIHTLKCEPDIEGVSNALTIALEDMPKVNDTASKYWRERVNHEVWSDRMEMFIRQAETNAKS